eukprot:7979587-Alexandrium_andersonii.AAC.1
MWAPIKRSTATPTYEHICVQHLPPIAVRGVQASTLRRRSSVGQQASKRHQVEAKEGGSTFPDQGIADFRLRDESLKPLLLLLTKQVLQDAQQIRQIKPL